MGQDAFHIGRFAVEVVLDAKTSHTPSPPSVTIVLLIICSNVRWVVLTYVCMQASFVTEPIIVWMVQMNLSLFARLHAQQACLPVLMACNAFLDRRFATVLEIVETYLTPALSNATIVLLTIFLSVRYQVSMFV